MPDPTGQRQRPRKATPPTADRPLASATNEYVETHNLSRVAALPRLANFATWLVRSGHVVLPEDLVGMVPPQVVDLDGRDLRDDAALAALTGILGSRPSAIDQDPRAVVALCYEYAFYVVAAHDVAARAGANPPLPTPRDLFAAGWRAAGGDPDEEPEDVENEWQGYLEDRS